jgi:hypothetical protein
MIISRHDTLQAIAAGLNEQHSYRAWWRNLVCGTGRSRTAADLESAGASATR